jgi:hypothetical protein
MKKSVGVLILIVILLYFLPITIKSRIVIGTLPKKSPAFLLSLFAYYFFGCFGLGLRASAVKVPSK